jgi:hypothetical protein
MALFQNSILKKYLKGVEDKTSTAYEQYVAYFHNLEIQENIRNSKEEQFQEGFLRELFVKILGYTLNPEPNFNLITEHKNETGSKKADGAILVNGEVVGVIELKDGKTTDLKQVESQVFGYKNYHRNASYVIISNFEKLRFYIDNAIDFIEFNLFSLSKEEFAILWLCLGYQNIASNFPKQIKAESTSNEDQITKQLYKEYADFKRALFDDLTKHNPNYDQLTLFKKSQKILDRILFILFAEDCGLLPPNSITEIIKQWESLKELDEYKPLYDRLKKYFGYMNTGHKGKKHDVFAYNGGLFKFDETLDNIVISDDVLHTHLQKLGRYDFSSEVDVNILGHIFEHSLTEIEEIANTLAGEESTATSKRKKDGVFYTPRYITTYIVENTLGKLCTDKKAELEIDETEYFADKKRQKTTKIKLEQKLNDYRQWLLSLTICDPACGSGAFLNATLDFLMNEHRLIDEMLAKLLGGGLVFPDIENAILENNLYGVDINEESVEIAKLSLWLRTAKPNRKLNSLNENIKCGNSLISDLEVAGDKAFDWHKEFPQVFANGGFDVIIGNPPYGVNFSKKEKEYLTSFDNLVPDFEIYIYFISLYRKILRNEGLLSYIFPNTFLSTLFGKRYRENLFENVSVYQIVDLSNDNTFEDASVRTCILSFEKKQSDYSTQLYSVKDKEFTLKNTYSKTEILKEVENILSLFSQTSEEKNIIDKIQKNPRLRSFLEVSQGYIPYRRSDLIKNFGDELGNKIVDERLWHSNKKISSEWKCEILGKEVRRYFYTHSDNYIKYGKQVASYVDEKFFTQQRILVREITADKLYCAIISKELYNNPSLINIINEKQVLDLKYCLSILNSSLIGWLHNKISPKANKGLFPKILINDVRSIPLVEVSKEEQQPFIDLADKILSLNSELQTKRQRFQKRLSDNFTNLKITGNLERFDESDFKQFVAELKKQKITLSLKQQDEWEEYFNDYKKDCNELSTQIANTDKEIDRDVYALYGLTDEEIKVIEK